MFINASAISGNLAANEGLLMHEMLHEVGLTDDNIGNALHSMDPPIKPDANGNWTNTKQFSKKLQSDCFSGKGYQRLMIRCVITLLLFLSEAGGSPVGSPRVIP